MMGNVVVEATVVEEDDSLGADLKLWSQTPA
jgi:hypothetical protein